MRAAGISLQEVMAALAASNLNVGGKVIEENGQEFVVRGIGLVKSEADLEEVVVRSMGGVPVYLRDLATISLGGEFRRGALDVDGREVVGGIVVMRTGENAMAVISAIKEKIAQLQPSLPPGVRIKAFYGTSENAVRTQVWTAVTAYLLVALVRKELKTATSLHAMLQIFSLTLFEKKPLFSAISDNSVSKNSPDLNEDPCLPGF
jgi:Cu(I)/Ag(I) efflux system membrane protein CusA/SilA